MIFLIFNLTLGLSLSFVFFLNNWLFVWVWLECITFCLIILMRTSYNNIRNLEALAKYFVTQAVASIFILVGIFFRYYTLNSFFLLGVYNWLSYLLIVLGLLVKLGVFPNPYWFIDVVSGLTFSRLSYILIISKIIPLYILCLLLNYNVLFLSGSIGMLTALVTSILGINQVNFRKLLGFSSLANLGWFVLCIPLMDNLVVLFSFLGYSFMVFPVLQIGEFFKVNALNKINRLYYTNSSKLALLFCLFSLGGLPPFVGFFIKWAFFQSLVSFSLYFLSFILVVSSLVSLFFYLYNSFNIYSLYSPVIKAHSVLSVSSSYVIGNVCVSVGLICFFSAFVFFGIIW